MRNYNKIPEEALDLAKRRALKGLLKLTKDNSEGDYFSSTAVSSESRSPLRYKVKEAVEERLGKSLAREEIMDWRLSSKGYGEINSKDIAFLLEEYEISKLIHKIKLWDFLCRGYKSGYRANLRKEEDILEKIGNTGLEFEVQILMELIEERSKAPSKATP